MRRRTHNYSRDDRTEENTNYDEKYAISGESQWSRDLTVPFDENEVLSERHFVLGDDAIEWERELAQEERGPEGDFSGIGPKGYRRQDRTIYEEVCEALWRSPEVDPSNIEVSVDQGVVRLRGHVQGRAVKHEAERLAEELPGVIDVMNEIRVDNPLA